MNVKKIFQQSRLSKKYKIIQHIKCCEGLQRGVLLKIQNRKTKKFKAVRLYDASSNINSHGIEAAVLRSMQSLVFTHPNILDVSDVELLRACDDMKVTKCRKAHIVMSMEFSKSNLEKWIKTERVNTGEKEIVLLANDILQSLAYLHRNHHMHPKLHPRNILLFDKKFVHRAKIADFQDLVIFSHEYMLEDYEQISEYLPPEILVGYTRFDCSTDMWIFGIILFEMIFGRTPFQVTKKINNRKKRYETLVNIWSWMGSPDLDWKKKYMAKEDTNIKPTEHKSIKKGVLENQTWLQKQEFSKETFDTCLDLINRCLQVEPGKRLTAQQALQHPLFQGFKVVRGHEIKIPKTPPTPKHHLTKMFLFERKDMLTNAVQDVQHGYMEYYPLVLSIAMFDRVTPLLWEDVTKDIQQVFCACYLISLKLLSPENTNDLFKRLKGLICQITPQSKLAILYYERIIVEKLNFLFYAADIQTLKMSKKFLKKLQTKIFQFPTPK